MHKRFGAKSRSQVKTANQYNLSFFPTGGGHGGETGFATVKQAVNIDLSNFKQNDLDVTANTLTVGPGISFGDFETNLYNAGKLARESCLPYPRIFVTCSRNVLQLLVIISALI